MRRIFFNTVFYSLVFLVSKFFTQSFQDIFLKLALTVPPLALYVFLYTHGEDRKQYSSTTSRYVHTFYDNFLSLLFMGATAGAFTVIEYYLVRHITYTELGLSEFVLSSLLFPLYHIFQDLCYYIYHSMAHNNRYFYKYIHKFHHQYKETFLLQTFYGNIFDSIFIVYTPFVLFFLLGIKISIFTFNLYYFTIFTHFLFGHVAVDKDYFIFYIDYPLHKLNILSRPTHHDKHHKFTMCNYGDTYLWDRLFKTLR